MGSSFRRCVTFVDSGLTLPDRVDLPGMKGPGTDLLHRVVFEEMNNLRQFYEGIDMAVLAGSWISFRRARPFM
jgi:hypothetical protein